jgi:hypothetical protein
MKYVSKVAQVLERIGRWNISFNACFTRFPNRMFALVLLITISGISWDRTRRAASNDVVFGSDTGTGSNIFLKNTFLKKFSYGKNLQFYLYSVVFYLALKSEYTIRWSSSRSLWYTRLHSWHVWLDESFWKILESVANFPYILFGDFLESHL